MVDLWPTKIEEDRSIKTPYSILQEQAKLLATKTRNLIKATVERDRTNKDDFTYDFYLVAPKLGNYHYRLFTLQHPIALYPSQVYLGEEMAKELRVTPMPETPINSILRSMNAQYAATYVVNASSENELIDILKAIFSSQRTIKILQSLLAQIQTA